MCVFRYLLTNLLYYFGQKPHIKLEYTGMNVTSVVRLRFSSVQFGLVGVGSDAVGSRPRVNT